MQPMANPYQTQYMQPMTNQPYPMPMEGYPGVQMQQQAQPMQMPMMQQPMPMMQQPMPMMQQPMSMQQSASPMSMMQQMVQPVMNQPTSGGRNWMMPPPQISPGCPPGLEYLTIIDQVIIKQNVDIIETFIDFEVSNTYMIVNNMGQMLYNAAEESNCLARYFCRKQRGFILHITNNFGQEVFKIDRPFKCCTTITGFSCPCAGRFWTEEVSVFSATGETFGNVRQDCSFCCPRYVLLDSQDTPVLRIEGPHILCLMCPFAEFKIVTPDRTLEVGVIKKQWSGLLKEAFTDADNFGVQFPMDLDVKMKAALIGGVFLIDFNYYEDNRSSAIETNPLG